MTHCHCVRGEAPEPCCPIHGQATRLAKGSLILALASAADQCEVLASNIAKSGDRDWAMGLAEQHAEKIAGEIRTVLRGDDGDG